MTRHQPDVIDTRLGDLVIEVKSDTHDIKWVIVMVVTVTMMQRAHQPQTAVLVWRAGLCASSTHA